MHVSYNQLAVHVQKILAEHWPTGRLRSVLFACLLSRAFVQFSRNPYMLHAELSTSITEAWSEVDALCLGSAPRHTLQTADLFVNISEDEHTLLRADIYQSPQPECFAFQDAIVWNNRIFVGYGECVYVIDPALRIGWQIYLTGVAGYFGAFYSAPGYLLVASGDSLLRLTDDGRVLWAAHDLGLDGVIVDSVENGIICGQGEWDPPGGWKPFELHLDSGQLIRSGRSPDCPNSQPDPGVQDPVPAMRPAFLHVDLVLAALIGSDELWNSIVAAIEHDKSQMVILEEALYCAFCSLTEHDHIDVQRFAKLLQCASIAASVRPFKPPAAESIARWRAAALGKEQDSNKVRERNIHPLRQA
jgi:hypothetical protein